MCSLVAAVNVPYQIEGFVPTLKIDLDERGSSGHMI